VWREGEIIHKFFLVMALLAHSVLDLTIDDRLLADLEEKTVIRFFNILTRIPTSRIALGDYSNSVKCLHL